MTSLHMQLLREQWLPVGMVCVNGWRGRS